MIPAFWLYRILGVACVAAALLGLVASRDRWKDRSNAFAKLYAQEQAAHFATIASYRAAAEQARRRDAEDVARAKAEQSRINERTKNDYESRIVAARADAQRLRNATAYASAPAGPGGAAPVHAVPDTAGRVDETAGENRFPADDRLLATEQAIQLDELIAWVRSQQTVESRSH